MSEENVEIVRSVQPSGVDLVSAFARGGDAVLGFAGSRIAADLESVFITEDAPTSIGPYRGLGGFVAGWRDWLEPWELYEINAEEFIDAADRVVVFARVRARTRRDKVEMEHAPAAVYTVRDRQVRRIEFYLDRAQALRSAGLGARQ